MVNADRARDRSNVFAKICAVLLIIYMQWGNIRVVRSKLLLILIFAFALINFLLRGDRLVSWNLYQTAFLILIVYCCIGTVYSQNILEGIRFFLQLTLAFGISLITFDDLPFLKTVLRWFSISSVVSVAAILLQVAFPSQILMISAALMRPEAYASTAKVYSYGYYSGLSGFNSIAGFHAAVLMGICFVNGLKSTKKIKRIANYMMAIISLLALIATQKRGVLLASMVAAFVTLVHYFWSQRSMKKLAQVMIIFCVIALLLYSLMLNTESGLRMLKRFTESDDISSGRFNHYQFILSSIKDRYLIGYGTGSLGVALGNNAHNVYLQILYDHGILGLMVYLVFFAIPLFSCLKKNRQGNVFVYALISLFIQVLFLSYGFTGNPLYDYNLFITYLLGILMMNVRQECSELAENDHKSLLINDHPVKY